jgi:SAM-dependent methyltransferase
MADARQIHQGGHHAPLAYHGKLLHDVHRMDAYDRAIRALVRPGDVVLDAGCGTGILAMLAARRGARVHAVESMPIAALARELVAHNGLADRVTVHHADLRTLAPVEPVDLIVGDFLGAFLIDDLMLPAIAAAARWLKPGGRCAPSEVQLRVAPADVAIRELDVFAAPSYGVDLAPALARARRQCHRVDVTPSVLLAPAADYATYAPPAALTAVAGTSRFEVTRPGVLRCLLGWFAATLAPGVVLDTGPGIETHWGQYLWPLPPTEVLPGDRLTVELACPRTAAPVWTWRFELARGDATIAHAALAEDTSWLDD